MLNNTHDMIQFFNNHSEFSAAIEYTAGRHEFSTNLIEKDYLCSLVLMYLYDKKSPLVFKGGTLLAKGHADFYRLSEDLDFSIPISPNATRNERSDKIKLIKNHVNNIFLNLPIFTVSKALSGSNESRQYNMELTYQSTLNISKGKILIKIGLRNELSQQPTKILAKTLLTDPYLSERKVSPFPIYGLTLHEAYAEKIRAALTRKRLAIRDFFDLDYALKNKIIDFKNPELIKIVKEKLTNEKLSPSLLQENEISNLREKINSELIPTLPMREFTNFDLNSVLHNLLITFEHYFSNTEVEIL